MSTEESKALVRRYFEEMDARRDVAIIDEFVGRTSLITILRPASRPIGKG